MTSEVAGPMLAMRTPSSDSRPAKASQFFTVDPLVNVIQVGLRFHCTYARLGVRRDNICVCINDINGGAHRSKSVGDDFSCGRGSGKQNSRAAHLVGAECGGDTLAVMVLRNQFGNDWIESFCGCRTDRADPAANGSPVTIAGAEALQEELYGVDAREHYPFVCFQLRDRSVQG